MISRIVGGVLPTLDGKVSGNIVLIFIVTELFWIFVLFFLHYDGDGLFPACSRRPMDSNTDAPQIRREPA